MRLTASYTQWRGNSKLVRGQESVEKYEKEIKATMLLAPKAEDRESEEATFEECCKFLKCPA